MPILIIGKTEREQIAAIIAHAKAHPVLFEQIRQGIVDDAPVMKFKDRKPGFERPRSQHILFPGGYHAAFSIEQQPAGFFTHLSISVEGRSRKGMMPSLESVTMIAEEFGVPFPADKSWNEEFAPGEYAINLLSMLTSAKEGTA